MNFGRFKKTDLLFCLVILSGLLFSQIALAGLSVAPLSMKLEASSGENASAILNIRNTGEEEIDINVQIVDWWRTPEGNLQFMTPGSRDRSCADWLIYSPTSLTIQPRERERVSIELEVPEGVGGDHWAMLLVTENPKAVDEEEQEVSTRVTVNYAVKILQKDPSNNQKTAKITNIEPLSVKPLKLAVTYKNTGPTHLRTTGRVEIRNLQGETVRTYQIDQFPTLPGEKHLLDIGGSDNNYENLEPGTYYAIVIMDFGGDHLIQGGLPIQIPES